MDVHGKKNEIAQTYWYSRPKLMSATLKNLK